MDFISESISKSYTLNMTSFFIFYKVNKLSFVKDISWFPLFGHLSITLCSSQQCSHDHSWVIKWSILIDNSSREFVTDKREEFL